MVAEREQFSKTQTPITGTYSGPISRHYRLADRDDVVPRDELPYEFVDSSKRINSQANRAFAPDGPATALFAQLDDPHLFTVHGDELGVPERYRHARCIRSKKTLAVWRAALKKTFTGAYLFKFEVALESNEIHVHILADEQAGLPDLIRGSQKCKPVTDPTGIIRYLSKPPCYPIKKRVKEYVRTKKRVGDGKLPEVSGYARLPPKAERMFQGVSLETPSQTQKTEVAESSCIYRALRPSRSRRLTLDRMERLLFAGSRGAVSRSWTPTGPPMRGST